MCSECANPACRARFDYQQGTFFRFRRPPREDGQPANTHSVQHFWLCGRCAESYYLEYVRKRGILLRSRLCAESRGDPLFIAVV